MITEEKLIDWIDVRLENIKERTELLEQQYAEAKKAGKPVLADRINTELLEVTCQKAAYLECSIFVLKEGDQHE